MSQECLSKSSTTSTDTFPAGFFSFVYCYQILYFYVLLLNYVFYITCILTMHKNVRVGQKMETAMSFVRTPTYMNTEQPTFGY